MRRIYTYLIIACFSFALAAVRNFQYDQNTTDQLLTNSITSKVEAQMSIIEKEVEQFIKQECWDSKYHMFLMQQGLDQPIRWTNNSFLPDFIPYHSVWGWKAIDHPRGIYLLYKKKIDEVHWVAALLPINQKFKIRNRYLEPTLNKDIFGSDALTVYSISNQNGITISLKQQEMFKVEPTTLSYQRSFSIVILGSIGILFLLLIIYDVVRQMHRKRQYNNAFLTLMIGLSLIRICMIAFEFPQKWTVSELFDPQVYASSFLNPTIGDLFFNMLVLLVQCGYLFIVASIVRPTNIDQWHPTLRFLLTVWLLLLAYLSILFPYKVVESISKNSTIIIDISYSIEWSFERIMAFLIILMSGISGFFLAHFLLRVSYKLKFRHSKQNILLAIILAAMLFYFLFFIFGQTYYITLCIVSIFFVILVISDLYTTSRFSSVSVFIYFILTVTILTTQNALLIRYSSIQKSNNLQQQIASDFIVINDILAEFLLEEGINNLINDPYIQANFTNSIIPKRSIAQKIKQVHLRSYFDRYDIDIYFFDAKDRLMDDLSGKSLTISDVALSDAIATNYQYIYLIPKKEASAKHYQAIVPIFHAGVLQGNILFDLSLKKYIPKRVFPELLTDKRFFSYLAEREINYAYFSKQQLVSSFGEYNYARDFDSEWLDGEEIFSEGITINDFHHIAVKSEYGEIVIVTLPAYQWLYFFANLSYWFLLGILILFIWFVINSIIEAIEGNYWSYSVRIQLFIYLSLIIPLIALAVAGVNQVNKYAEDRINTEYESKSENLGEAITSILEENRNEDEFINSFSLLAKSANSDFSIYDTKGYLLSTTQPAIFESQFISRLINPRAYEKLKLQGFQHIFEDESIGTLRYRSSFRALFSSTTGEVLGYLSIPFFDSAQLTERIRITVFTNIMIIFTVILSVFLLLSFAAARWLTHPLRWITETLSRTSLKHNEKMVWKGDDEIGMMVSEYNKLVDNLEQSQVELAQSQKESAWREIAQQVAHEIKNPLTPMKLMIQQMEDHIKNNKLDERRSLKSLNNMLNQVSILDDIATSFSSFAKMPTLSMKKLNIVPLLKQVVSMFGNDQRGEVTYNPTEESLICLVDEPLILRIFSNIILNALQSAENKHLSVTIKTIINNRDVIISFLDNGAGIQEHDKPQIFLPDFTTKKSGSGIGLAISKQGISQMGGLIWFHSQKGEGSTFYISLPLADTP